MYQIRETARNVLSLTLLFTLTACTDTPSDLQGVFENGNSHILLSLLNGSAYQSNEPLMTVYKNSENKTCTQLISVSKASAKHYYQAGYAKGSCLKYNYIGSCSYSSESHKAETIYYANFYDETIEGTAFEQLIFACDIAKGIVTVGNLDFAETNYEGVSFHQIMRNEVCIQFDAQDHKDITRLREEGFIEGACERKEFIGLCDIESDATSLLKSKIIYLPDFAQPVESGNQFRQVENNCSALGGMAYRGNFPNHPVSVNSLAETVIEPTGNDVEKRASMAHEE